MQDLKWEIKFFKRERGEEGDREKQTRCHAGNKWGPKGELRPVSVGRIAHWDEGHLAGHQAPNQFLTWGVDQGGQGMVETTCTQARHESKSGINRRQQTVSWTALLNSHHHPPSHSQKIPTFLGNPPRTYCHGLGHVFIIFLLVSCKSLLTGITPFSLSRLNPSFCILLLCFSFKRVSDHVIHSKSPQWLPTTYRGHSELLSITKDPLIAIASNLHTAYVRTNRM